MGSAEHNAAEAHINKHTHTHQSAAQACRHGQWDMVCKQCAAHPPPLLRRIFCLDLLKSPPSYTLPRNNLDFSKLSSFIRGLIFALAAALILSFYLSDVGKRDEEVCPANLMRCSLVLLYGANAEGVKAQPVVRINPSAAHLDLERKTINSAFSDWHRSSAQPRSPRLFDCLCISREFGKRSSCELIEADLRFSIRTINKPLFLHLLL